VLGENVIDRMNVDSLLDKAHVDAMGVPVLSGFRTYNSFLLQGISDEVGVSVLNRRDQLILVTLMKATLGYFPNCAIYSSSKLKHPLNE
jgi:hypothetical protein